MPILSPLSRDEKLTLLDAFEEQHFAPEQTVVQQVQSAAQVGSKQTSVLRTCCDLHCLVALGGLLRLDTGWQAA